MFVTAVKSLQVFIGDCQSTKIVLVFRNSHNCETACFWLHEFGYTSLVKGVWLHEFGHTSLVTGVWLHEFGYGCLVTRI